MNFIRQCQAVNNSIWCGNNYVADTRKCKLCLRSKGDFSHTFSKIFRGYAEHRYYRMSEILLYREKD